LVRIGSAKKTLRLKVETFNLIGVRGCANGAEHSIPTLIFRDYLDPDRSTTILVFSNEHDRIVSVQHPKRNPESH